MNARLAALPRRSNHLESIPCNRPLRGHAPANRRKFPPAHPLTVLDPNRTESALSRITTPSHPRRPPTTSRQKRATSALLTLIESHPCTMSPSKLFRITSLRKNRGGEVITLTTFPKWNRALQVLSLLHYFIASLFSEILVARNRDLAQVAEPARTSASLLSRPNMERVECRRTSFL